MSVINSGNCEERAGGKEKEKKKHSATAGPLPNFQRREKRNSFCLHRCRQCQCQEEDEEEGTPQWNLAVQKVHENHRMSEFILLLHTDAECVSKLNNRK